jgi:hypothetical protein
LLLGRLLLRLLLLLLLLLPQLVPLCQGLHWAAAQRHLHRQLIRGRWEVERDAAAAAAAAAC